MKKVDGDAGLLEMRVRVLCLADYRLLLGAAEVFQ